MKSWERQKRGQATTIRITGKMETTLPMHQNNHHPRRGRSYPQRSGVIRAHQGLGHALADFYFRLRAGTKKQQQAAEDLKHMVLSMREGLA